MFAPRSPWRRWLTTASVIGSCICPWSVRAEPAMWVVKDVDSTIYLLGTFHILRPETVWKTPKIKKALARSTELWLEIADDQTVDTTALLGKYGIDGKEPLSSQLNEEDRALLKKTADEYTFPMPLLENMKPWYAGMTLMLVPLMKAGYNPNAGVEMILRVDARLQGDRVRGFETFEEQMQILDGLPNADQIAFLRSIMKDVQEGIAFFAKLEEAWSTGDIDAMQRHFVEPMKGESASLYQSFLVDRNVRWSEKIAKMLNGSGVQFIAVGAGHLIGPDSVQAQLQKRGIKSRRY